jgi:small-conductance mechanosensitive channel/CRP-like cAMP-binding protein
MSDLSGLTGSYVTHFVDRWMFAFVGTALVFIAWLVNRFAPQSRKHVRRTAILYVLYVFAFAASVALDAVGATAWASRLHFASSLLEAFTLVSLGGLFIFDFAAPALKFDLVSITTDIAIGIAYIVATIAVLRGAGMDLSSVIATSAIVSGVLALSLQATLGNILGGVALQLDGSIHVGDWLQLENGRQGKVKEIRWRHTVVETRDWDTVIVPNASLLASNIMILGKREGAAYQHRMWVYFNVDFRFAPQTVISVVNDALQNAPLDNVAAEPKAHAICLDFAKDGRDSYACYAVRYYLTDLAVDDPTSSLVRTRIFSALRRAGIPLARPARSLFVTPDDDTQEQKRHQRHREKRLAAVTSVELFKGLREAEHTFVADRLRYAPFCAGETVTKQGAVAHWLYLLTSGSVEIRPRIDGISRAVATVEAPDFFGEAGLMTGEPRSADVVAATDVECYRLDKAGFEKIVHDRPEVATQISETVASRRVELIAARDGLDAESKRLRQSMEQERILSKIQEFFGLE